MLAVIPARGGSKGVEGKNIKKLVDKPLLAYTIEAALRSKVFDKVIVSTDAIEIADIALEYGAEIPFMRPNDISGDKSPSDEAVVHALNYFENEGIIFENVCKLQPTSPLRTAEHIKEAYRMFLEKDADFVVSVCECEHSPLWSGTLGDTLSLDNFILNKVQKLCRQELPIYYRLNGAIYMGKSRKFTKIRNFFGNNGYAYIMKQKESIDIDTELDFLIAEMILNSIC